MLLNRIRHAFAGAPSYGNKADLVAALIAGAAFPIARTIGAGNKAEIRHPFGGLVTVTGGPGGITNRFASSSPMSITRSARRWAMPMPGAAGRGPG